LACIDATRYEAQYEQAKAALERSIADLASWRREQSRRPPSCGELNNCVMSSKHANH
jgi:hypothetical protein